MRKGKVWLIFIRILRVNFVGFDFVLTTPSLRCTCIRTSSGRLFAEFEPTAGDYDPSPLVSDIDLFVQETPVFIPFPF